MRSHLQERAGLIPLALLVEILDALVDEELSVLGPVGFWLANTLGPKVAFAIGVLVSMATDGTGGASAITGAGGIAGIFVVLLVLFLLRGHLWQKRS